MRGRVIVFIIVLIKHILDARFITTSPGAVAIVPGTSTRGQHLMVTSGGEVIRYEDVVEGH